MVDVAKYFIEFLREESCGKCTSCREGTEAMYNILNKICEGKGQSEDIALLEDLAEAIQEGSLCGLGQTAPNPVMSTLRYFKEEYETHIRDKRCPAGVCKSLIRYRIDEEKCTACMVCKKGCSVDAITGEKKQSQRIDTELCIKCGACYEVCKFDAVIVD